MTIPRPLLLDLFRHMEWADAKVWSTVPLASPPDARLRHLLVHLHVVQQAFHAVWTHRDVRTIVREPEEFATLVEVRDWARGAYAGASAFVDAASDGDLAAPLALPWSGQLTAALGRAPGPTTLAETCLQVANHSTYHRGQVNARVRELGREPALVDYIAWIWFERPAPEWPR